MERDLDLARDILLYIEEEFDPAEGILIFAPGDIPDELTDEHGEWEMMQHLDLLYEAGLVNVRLPKGRRDFQRDTMGRPGSIAVRGLSHEGHDFLENIRDDTLWKRAKEESRSLALDVVRAAAEGVAMGAIGGG